MSNTIEVEAKELPSTPPPPSVTLTMRKGPQPGQQFTFIQDIIALGRRDDNDVVIDNPQISRRHASLSWEEGTFVLRDLGSANGTFLNAVRITEPHALREGDVIGLGGDAVLSFSITGSLDKTMVVSGTKIRKEMAERGVAFPGAAPPVALPSPQTGWSGLVIAGLIVFLLVGIGAVVAGWFLLRESTTACTPDAELVKHVSIADGTVIEPGGRIDKVWKVKNTGTCPWEEGYLLVFYSGDQMRAPDYQALPGTAPDKTTNIGATMVAPFSPGTYTAAFRFKSPTGEYFGPELSVTIVIEQPSPLYPAPTGP
ncbi:MAG: FHA domain-containing protein [Anaerolineales bacterium]|nr:MAG: FHA domain-containing protein [Anaerolineales bacterium]